MWLLSFNIWMPYGGDGGHYFGLNGDHICSRDCWIFWIRYQLQIYRGMRTRFFIILDENGIFYSFFLLSILTFFYCRPMEAQVRKDKKILVMIWRMTQSKIQVRMEKKMRVIITWRMTQSYKIRCKGKC